MLTRTGEYSRILALCAVEDLVTCSLPDNLKLLINFHFHRDLIPIISALEYNSWFVKFRASHTKLNHEVTERILHLISKSFTLEELYLDNTGAKTYVESLYVHIEFFLAAKLIRC